MLNLEQATQSTLNNLKDASNKLWNKDIDLSKLNEYIKLKSFDERVLLLWWNQISWSLSPIIHTLSSIDEWKDLLYTLINLEKEENISIENILCHIEKSQNILWSNVTMPYKIDVFNILEKENKLDVSALIVWAVNTISKENSEIRWYNTDMEWIIWPIKWKLLTEEILNINKWFVLWAWWAARAAIWWLLSLWINDITFFNKEKVPDLIKHFKSNKV